MVLFFAYGYVFGVSLPQICLTRFVIGYIYFQGYLKAHFIFVGEEIGLGGYLSPSITRNHIYNVFRRIEPVTVTVHEHLSKVHHEPKHVCFFLF